MRVHILLLYCLLLSTSTYGGTTNCTQHGSAVLTFDDGVTENTSDILDTLKTLNTPATFFLIGETLVTPRGSKMLTRIINEGHTVGNHTWSHPHLPSIKNYAFDLELLNTQNAFPSIPRLFRPPYGALGPYYSIKVDNMGFTVVGWNMDLKDWQLRKNKRKIWESLITQIKKINPNKNSVVLLLHNTKRTSELLPDIIFAIKLSGFTITTLDKCLKA
jgi:peptidoglycan/xylan/chitin deacetylase (PgdA/CDA1 family)